MNKFLFVSFLVLVSCIKVADNLRRPVLRYREREEYVITYGVHLSWTVRKAFIDGRVIPGMPKGLVEEMYGPPDLVTKCPGVKSLVCDYIYYYGANNSHTVGSISMLADTVVKATGQLAGPSVF